MNEKVRVGGLCDIYSTVTMRQPLDQEHGPALQLVWPGESAARGSIILRNRQPKCARMTGKRRAGRQLIGFQGATDALRAVHSPKARTLG